MDTTEHSFLSDPSGGAGETPGWSLTESVYPAGLTMNWHEHERAYMSVVLRGGYSERCGRRSRACGSSSVMLHAPGDRHAVRFLDTSTRIFRVELRAGALALLRDADVSVDEPAELRDSRVLWLAARLRRAWRDDVRMGDSLGRLAVEGLICELFAELPNGAAGAGDVRPPRWLGDADDLLRAQFREPIGLRELAAAVGVHPVYFARVFRRHRRTSVAEIVRRLRVEEACRALATTDVPIAALAFDLGFCDQSHFSRNFARVTGLTPSRFRETFR